MNYYGYIGTNGQMESAYSPGTGWTKMLKERPTGQYIAQEDGEWVVDYQGIESHVKERLNCDFNEAMAAVHAGWPEYEVQTWTVQNEEARKWLASSAEDKPYTPLLSGMHSVRTTLGWVEPFEDFVGRVIRNSDQYTATVAALLAIRHISERAIEQADDPESIEWSFNVRE